MMDELGLDTQSDVQTLVKDAPAVERTDTQVWEDPESGESVIDIGEGSPIIRRVVGEEFLQTFVCLSQPAPAYELPDDASVGEWV